MSVSRRDFARLLALGGSGALLPVRDLGAESVDWERLGFSTAPVRSAPQQPDERYWDGIRARFLVPRDVAFLNAANLCPAPLPVVEAMERNVRNYEASPSPEVRSGLMRGREEARQLLAAAFRVTPEEIVLTRNTTEGNNFVSSGLTLGPGDEVVVWADNHPSNLAAWNTKARRFGFSVVTVPVPAGHPGPEGYVDLFTRALTPRTRVLAFSHVSSNSGDLLPAAELCRIARDRGVLTLVDGAQTFGVLDVDLGAMQPDFYTGSMHKWPCGPKETGLFFVNKAVHDRIHPTVIGVYPGAVGISRQFEAEGQRDDASIAAVVEALKFQETVGRAAIERRARHLATRFVTEIGRLPGVKVWTDLDPARRAAVVVLQPGTLDPRRLGTALAERDKVVLTTRNGQDRPGLRLSPHFYNTAEDVDRTVSAIKGYLASGV